MNLRNEENKTPLHFAIEGNQLSTCELLLDLGAELVWVYNFYLSLNRLRMKLKLLSNQKIFNQSSKISRHLMPLIFSQKYLEHWSSTEIHHINHFIPNLSMINWSHYMNSILKYSWWLMKTRNFSWIMFNQIKNPSLILPSSNNSRDLLFLLWDFICVEMGMLGRPPYWELWIKE